MGYGKLFHPINNSTFSFDAMAKGDWVLFCDQHLTYIQFFNPVKTHL
jgi:hypothetical protein